MTDVLTSDVNTLGTSVNVGQNGQQFTMYPAVSLVLETNSSVPVLCRRAMSDSPMKTTLTAENKSLVSYL